MAQAHGSLHEEPDEAAGAKLQAGPLPAEGHAEREPTQGR